MENKNTEINGETSFDKFRKVAVEYNAGFIVGSYEVLAAYHQFCAQNDLDPVRDEDVILGLSASPELMVSIGINKTPVGFRGMRLKERHYEVETIQHIYSHSPETNSL